MGRRKGMWSSPSRVKARTVTKPSRRTWHVRMRYPALIAEIFDHAILMNQNTEGRCKIVRPIQRTNWPLEGPRLSPASSSNPSRYRRTGPDPCRSRDDRNRQKTGTGCSRSKAAWYGNTALTNASASSAALSRCAIFNKDNRQTGFPMLLISGL